MPTVALCPTFGVGYQAFTSSGIPLNGGLINTYVAGSTTPLATHTTKDGDVANSNPIVLATDGRPVNEIWLNVGMFYRFDLMDSLGNLIKSYDNIISFMWENVRIGSGANLSIDPNIATIESFTESGLTTITLPNASSYSGSSVLIKVIGIYAITWAGSVIKWAGGVVPTQGTTAGTYSIYSIVSDGTGWAGIQSGINFA